MNKFIKENCPICKEKTFVEYLGVISNENRKSFQLFKCLNKKKHNIEYFKKSKIDNKIIKIDFPYEKKEKDIMIRSILNSRVKCPKHKEHHNKDKDHEYIYVVSLGSENSRYYCRNHPDRTYHNRYEFIFPKNKKVEVTLLSLLNTIDDELYEKLRKVYNNENKYDLILDVDMLLKILLRIGLSDSIIASIFKVNQSTINRHKNKLNLGKITKIKTIKFSNKFPFHSKVNEITQKELFNIVNYLSSIKFE